MFLTFFIIIWSFYIHHILPAFFCQYCFWKVNFHKFWKWIMDLLYHYITSCTWLSEIGVLLPIFDFCFHEQTAEDIPDQQYWCHLAGLVYLCWNMKIMLDYTENWRTWLYISRLQIKKLFYDSENWKFFTICFLSSRIDLSCKSANIGCCRPHSPITITIYYYYSARKMIPVFTMPFSTVLERWVI